MYKHPLIDTHTHTRTPWRRWKRHLCQHTGYTHALSRTVCQTDSQFVCNSVSLSSLALSLFLFSYVVQTSNTNRSRWFFHTHIFENGFCIKTKESVNDGYLLRLYSSSSCIRVSFQIVSVDWFLRNNSFLCKITKRREQQQQQQHHQHQQQKVKKNLLEKLSLKKNLYGHPNQK